MLSDNINEHLLKWFFEDSKKEGSLSLSMYLIFQCLMWWVFSHYSAIKFPVYFQVQCVWNSLSVCIVYNSPNMAYNKIVLFSKSIIHFFYFLAESIEKVFFLNRWKKWTSLRRLLLRDSMNVIFIRFNSSVVGKKNGDNLPYRTHSSSN